MDFVSATVLSFVQGITEFIPVSSSAHLLFVRKFLGLSYDHAFDIFLNIGTALAIIVYFWNESCALFVGGIDFLRFKKTSERAFFFNIAVASLPTIIVFGMVEVSFGGQAKSSVIFISCMLIFSVVLYFCDRFFKAVRAERPSLKEWLFVGCAQVISIFPGVSRLGITASAFRILGFKRQETFKYSMLLSLPAVLGALFLKFIKIFCKSATVPAAEYVLICTICSFVVGFLTIKLVDHFFKKHTFLIFVIYRIFLALFLVVSSKNLLSFL